MELRKFLMYQLSAAQANVEALKALIAGIDSDGGTTEAAPAKETKAEKKSAKSTKTEKAPAKDEAADEETSSDADDLDLDGDDEASDEPTLDDVRKVVKDFATKHGKEKALKLLSKFNVTSIPDIKKSDYSKVIELAKKHL